jgi:hypothetical protein
MNDAISKTTLMLMLYASRPREINVTSSAAGVGTDRPLQSV